MKKLLLPLLMLTAHAAEPQVDLNYFVIEYPVHPIFEEMQRHQPVRISLAVNGLNDDVEDSKQWTAHISNLTLTDARGNQLPAALFCYHPDSFDIDSSALPQGISMTVTGTYHLYTWVRSVPQPPLQPDWENGCTLNQNGMQIHVTKQVESAYLHQYCIEVSVPTELPPTVEISVLQEDASSKQLPCSVETTTEADGRFIATIYSSTPLSKQKISLHTAVVKEYIAIPFCIRMGVCGRLMPRKP